MNVRPRTSIVVSAAIVVCFFWGQVGTGNGNEAKVTSSGGYGLLNSKSQDKGSVKIIVQVRTPITPESPAQARDVDEQHAMISAAQDRLVTDLENKGFKLNPFYKYKYTPYLSMTVDSVTLDALLTSPDVISVEEDIPVPPTLNWSVPHIGASQLHATDITGAGVAVAILDTGVDKTHPFLQDSVISEACYSTNNFVYGSSSLCPGGVEESVHPGSAMPYGGNCPSPWCSHGTHVAGIAAGRSGVIGSPGPGIAPDAGIIAIQVFSRFDSWEVCSPSASPCALSWFSDIMKGLERVYELRSTYLIASVNLSLGGGMYSGTCDSNPLKAYIDELRAAGIATIAASGNDGLCGSISAPACISTAISVGATDDSDAVADYSNNASYLSLLAPGSSISSAIPLADGGGYQNMSGTSMATPHVAGAWALIKQAVPAATVTGVLDSFTSTGLGVADIGCFPVRKQRINVYEAYATYRTLTVTISGNGAVTSTALGIDCPDDCSESYTQGTRVTLTAQPDRGATFAGWSDGCSGTNPECVLAMNENLSVTATFSPLQPSPGEGSIGTEFTITGSGFGANPGRVLIGSTATSIVQWTDTVITCRLTKVPLSVGAYNLTIVYPPYKTTSPIILPNAFAVKGPEIAPLVPDHGAPSAPITLSGKFFSTKKGKVYIEDPYSRKKKTCKITNWSMDPANGESTLTFVVPKLPKGFTPGAYRLKIINKVGFAETMFTVEPLP